MHNVVDFSIWVCRNDSDRRETGVLVYPHFTDPPKTIQLKKIAYVVLSIK